MTFQHINPAGTHHPSHIYTHVVVPPPGRVVFGEEVVPNPSNPVLALLPGEAQG